MKTRITSLICFILCTTLLFNGCGISKGPKLNKYSIVYFDYFDTVATIVGYEETEEQFQEVCDYIKDQLEWYDSLYDNYNALSSANNLYVINRDAAKAPVLVDEDVIKLFKLGKEIYTTTNGLTDFAMGSVFSIWHEHREDASFDPANATLPSMDELVAASLHCNIDDVIIDESASTIFYQDSELKCDVGAFAKGYAIERITQDLIAMGVEHYSLNVGGNVRTIGTKPDGSLWTVAIQNPDLAAEDSYSELINISDMALSTSGSYQRFYYVDGQIYHHIINPTTLFPENNFLSVSVLNTDAGLGDAYSTAIFNMSLEDGQAFVKTLDNTEVMWILPDGSKVYSDGFKKYIKN